MLTAALVASLLLMPDPDPSVRWGERLSWAADDGPEAREHAVFVVEPGRDRALLLAGSGYRPYGSPLGDAWAFDLAAGSWSPLTLEGDTLTPGGSRRSAFLPETTERPARLFLHGGYAEGFAGVGALWELEPGADRLSVRELPQTDAPPERMLHAFACDTRGERFVLFGGAGEAGLLGDTWLGLRDETGVSWRQLATETDPGPRLGFAFAFDAGGERLLVCGGQTPPTAEQPGMATARDLWALDLAADTPSWSRLATYTAEQFPGRRNPAWVFDEVSGDLLVWGGTGDGATALPDLFVVATREPGAPVTRLAQHTQVSTRASCFGALDGRRDRALLGFGNDSRGTYLDLVEVLLRRAGPGSADEPQDSASAREPAPTDVR